LLPEGDLLGRRGVIDGDGWGWKLGHPWLAPHGRPGRRRAAAERRVERTARARAVGNGSDVIVSFFLTGQASSRGTQQEDSQEPSRVTDTARPPYAGPPRTYASRRKLLYEGWGDR